MLCLISLSLLVSSVLAQSSNSPYIWDNTLGEEYPYAVHLPVNNDQALPPTILMLGGKGSMFQEGVTFPLDDTVSFGGAGWRVSRYANGSREAADVLVAEQFTTIIPYIYAWNGDANGDANYTNVGIMNVLQDAASKYPIDLRRVYVSGYSMGARELWSLIEENPDTFAAASICAGVPVPVDTSNVGPLASTPIRIYTGTADYEFASQVWQSEAYYNAMQADGNTNVELIYNQGTTHNDMQQVPYDEAMFQWFLTNTNTRIVNVPEEGAATSTNTAVPSAYSSINSAFDSYYSANSWSFYAAGFPSSARPSPPAGYTPSGSPFLEPSATANGASGISAGAVITNLIDNSVERAAQTSGSNSRAAMSLSTILLVSIVAIFIQA